MRPVWLQLVGEYNGKGITLIDHDRDYAGRAFADEYRFFSQPAIVIFDAHGELVKADYGPYTGAELRALVEALLPARTP
jgi:hypothetical protein